MSDRLIYLDHSATTQIRPEVLEEMMPFLTSKYGNASSIYSLGRDSRIAVDKARIQVAKALNADNKEIYFTGSGTESDNWAIKGVAHAYRNEGMHLITSAIEHPAVLNVFKALEKEGYKVTYLPVNTEGLISLSELEAAIREDTILISIMTANNEIGTIQPISSIGEIAHKHNIIFHTDAVQAVGTVKIDVKAMNIDLLSLSGHKFYAPKGCAALFIRKGIRLETQMIGGHQERGKRASTENVAGIVGLGKAIELATNEIDAYMLHLTGLRDYLKQEIEARIPTIIYNGSVTERLPGNANFSFRYIEGESLLLMLDMFGICASSGSACTSGSLDPSHVLLAIGLPHEIAHGSLRMTFGRENTKDDVDYTVSSLEVIVQRLRDMSPLYEKKPISGKEE
ncbi:cysteine desulfurase NifS [bacterium]|nr:MAG: cysteine desulfurase NifS [bacterium]